jgi:hypothetical protein
MPTLPQLRQRRLSQRSDHRALPAIWLRATSLPVKDPYPINVGPTSTTQDPAADQVQLELPLSDPKATIEARPGSLSTTRDRLDREIDWSGTPWEADIFYDNEDFRACKNAILTFSSLCKLKCCS